MQSNELNELFTALALAQGESMAAVKDSTGQVGTMKTRYADLASCWEACRVPLAKHGLSVVQIPSAEGPRVTIETWLGHKSGQWMSGTLTMTASEATPRGIGSAITYARRYSLCSMVGISPEDDDGEAASKGSKEAQRVVMEQKLNRPAPTRPAASPAPHDLGVSEADLTERRLEQSVDSQMTTTEKMWAKMTNIKGSLDVFASLKTSFIAVFGKDAGEKMYYSKLGAYGMDHANQFKKGDEARKCAAEMLESIRDAGPVGITI